MINPTNFSYWKKRPMQMASPFSRKPLTEISAFLEHSCAGGIGAEVTQWDIFPDIYAAGGFIRHMFFSFAFETWLVREEWDADPKVRISVAELLLRGKDAAQCRYRKDIPVMMELDARLGKALQFTDAGEAGAEVQSVIRKFNRRWSSGGTWSFSLFLAVSPQEVAKRLCRNADLLDGIDTTPAQVRELAACALKDKAGQAAFRRLLAECAQY